MKWGTKTGKHVCGARGKASIDSRQADQIRSDLELFYNIPRETDVCYDSRFFLFWRYEGDGLLDGVTTPSLATSALHIMSYQIT
jgi:hypothetical protein